MKKRSIMLLISLIIVILYLALQFQTYSENLSVLEVEATTMEQSAEQAGTAIGLALLLPHMILVILGAIFNAVAWIGKQRWAALTAAILYTVGGVLGIINFVFFIVPMVLCYIVYGKSKPTSA